MLLFLFVLFCESRLTFVLEHKNRCLNQNTWASKGSKLSLLMLLGPLFFSSWVSHLGLQSLLNDQLCPFLPPFSVVLKHHFYAFFLLMTDDDDDQFTPKNGPWFVWLIWSFSRLTEWMMRLTKYWTVNINHNNKFDLNVKHKKVRNMQSHRKLVTNMFFFFLS